MARASIRRRHLRHGRYSRVRRAKNMEAWLAAEQADLAGTMAAGITVTMSGAVAASAVLTLGANPTDNDTLTVGAKTYRFKNTTAQANDVKIGASAAATITNLVAAIKANGTGDGTDYHAGTTANATVDAADGTGDTVNLTALTAGVAGNLIAISETFTSASNTLSGETLSGGLDLSVFTATAHGLDVGEGPFVITAATTLPSGYAAGDLLWIHTVPTANTFTVKTSRRGKVMKTFVDDGTGTLTFRRKDNEESVFELLKQRKSIVISGSTDIDNLT